MDLVFRVGGVWGLAFRVSGFGVGGSWVLDLGLRVLDLGCWVLGQQFRGFGFRVLGAGVLNLGLFKV